MKKAERIMAQDTKLLTMIQLYFASNQAHNSSSIVPSQFFSVLFIALYNSDLPETHKNYIAEKLNLKNFNNKQELIHLLIDELEKLNSVSITNTPAHIIDGGLRMILVLISFSNLNDLDVIKNINRLLSPCFEQYQASNN